jgi:hypothetical protein
MAKNIMEFEKVLPVDYDGTFRFTNDSDEDFTATWGKVNYTFPAHTTSPMIMPDFTALEVQQIRKRFAEQWATREFGKSKEYGNLMRQERSPEGIPLLTHYYQAGQYSLNELAPYIQRCLIPLPEAKASVEKVETIPMEEKLSKDDEGNTNTFAVSKQGLDLVQEKKSLRKKALAE